MSKKQDQHLKKLIVEYVTSILQLVESVKPSNINQVISLIKANIRVLENDTRKSFSQDDYARDYN